MSSVGREVGHTEEIGGGKLHWSAQILVGLVDTVGEQTRGDASAQGDHREKNGGKTRETEGRKI